jgi:hypothetical protein
LLLDSSMSFESCNNACFSILLYSSNTSVLSFLGAPGGEDVLWRRGGVEYPDMALDAAGNSGAGCNTKSVLLYSSNELVLSLLGAPGGEDL